MTLLGSLLDLGLPAVFVATMLAPTLGKGDEAQKNRSVRTLSFAQVAVGGVAIGSRLILVWPLLDDGDGCLQGELGGAVFGIGCERM